MKNRLKLATLMSVLLLSVGCLKQTPDGKIPDKYREEAQKFVGTYAGKFNGQANVAKFEISENGRAYLTFENPLFDEDCNTAIGQLTALGKKRAVFDFDPGSCWRRIPGNGLVVEYWGKRNGKDRVSVNILRDRLNRRMCDIGGPWPGPRYPDRCDDIYLYYKGIFTKQ